MYSGRFKLNFFEIVTSYGTRLFAERSTGLLFHAVDGPAEQPAPAFLMVPPGLQVGFLMVVDHRLARFYVPGDFASYRFMPLRLQRLATPSKAALSQCYWGRYLSAAPPQPGEDQATLTIDGERLGACETFTLQAVRPDLPPPLARLLGELATWAALRLTGPALLDRMERGCIPRSADVFDAVARLLPPDQLDWLANGLLDHPIAAAALARVFPSDIYATMGLPALSQWLAERRKPAALVHDHPHLLAMDGFHGTYISFPHLCSARARRSVLPRKTVAILSTVRNEGPYLLEWLAYHRSIGVQDFFIYSNDNTDGSDALLAALAAAGVITWVDNHVEAGQNAQLQAYGHGTGVLPAMLDDRWTLVIDSDEFFVFDPSRFGCIGDFIGWHEARPVDAIALSWLVFTSGGQVRWNGGRVTTRFTQRVPAPDNHNKTLSRTCKMIQARPHQPMFDPRENAVTRNASGEILVPHEMNPSLSQYPEDKTAWINHYLFRSAEEFLLKNSRVRGPFRGELSPTHIRPDLLDVFLTYHQGKDLVRDTRVLDVSQSILQQQEALRALPGVAAAERRVNQRFRSEIDQLVAVTRTDPLFADPCSPYGRLAALLA